MLGDTFVSEEPWFSRLRGLDIMVVCRSLQPIIARVSYSSPHGLPADQCCTSSILGTSCRTHTSSTITLHRGSTGAYCFLACSETLHEYNVLMVVQFSWHTSISLAGLRRVLFVWARNTGLISGLSSLDDQCLSTRDGERLLYPDAGGFDCGHHG